MFNQIKLSDAFLAKASEYSNKFIILKVGGDLLEEKELENISRQIAELYNQGAKIAIVHGGAPHIDKALELRNMLIKQDYQSGVRLTDLETLKLADIVLLERNQVFVTALTKALGSAENILGISGYDDDLVLANKEATHFGGVVCSVNVAKFKSIINEGKIAIINPICKNVAFKGIEVIDEAKINPNGDDIALQMFEDLGATDLVLCSDTGVKDANKNNISVLISDEVENMIDSGVISGGMITKVRRAIEAIDNNSSGNVYIINGKRDWSIIDAIKGNNIEATRIAKEYSPEPLLKPVAFGLAY